MFLFFTSSILEHIVRQSNMYAGEMMGERFAQWQLYTVEQLCAYFGFMILLGIVQLPTLSDYWKKDEVFHCSALAKRISRDHFLDLHRYFHCVDNSTLQPPWSPGYEKLGKVRPIVNMISDCLAKIYLPGKKFSIDEAMIAFKGRSSLKQYMPQKPVKRGI